MSSNVIFYSLISHVVKGIIEGTVSIDALCSKLGNLWNLSGFPGDQQASSKDNDFLNHMDRAACTHYMFRFKSGNLGSKISYKKMIYTRSQPTLCRLPVCWAEIGHGWKGRYWVSRYEAMRHWEYQGAWEIANGKAAPWDANVCSYTAKPFNERPALIALIDRSTSSDIAPDHLLIGFGKGLLDYVFLQIIESSSSLSFRLLAMLSAKTASLETHQEHLSERMKATNSVTMSTTFFLIAIFPFVLSTTKIETATKQIFSLATFSMSMAGTYPTAVSNWWKRGMRICLWIYEASMISGTSKSWGNS